MPQWQCISSFVFYISPTDLNIDRGHLLITDFLPTKFEASGAKLSWLIGCTRCRRLTWPLTFTFDLLTWKSIGIIYSSRTIYLPSLKLLRHSVLELSVAQGVGYQHALWPLTWISIGNISSSSTIYLPSLKLLGQSLLELSVAQGYGKPTFRPTNWKVQSNMPLLFQRGHKNNQVIFNSFYNSYFISYLVSHI